MVSRNFRNILVLLILSWVFFMAGNGIISLSNPDEVFYNQTAREMAGQETWAVPHLFNHPQFEKPIFMYWLLRAGLLVFGASHFGARFFPAFFAAAGVIAVYLFVFGVYKEEKRAFICALVLMSSVLYVGLSRVLLTDMVFSVWVLLSLVSFFWGYLREERRAAGIILFFVFSALAVLTKGPIGLFIPLLAVLLFLGIRKEVGFLYSRYFVWGALIFLAVSIPWYAFMIKKFGYGFIHEFFYNDHIRRIFVAEHKQYDRWYFYPALMVVGMGPWSVYTAGAFVYLFKQMRKKDAPPLYLFLACWVFAVFIIFQPAHSKLISYILPMFPALAIITGDFIYSAIAMNKERIMYALTMVTLFLLVLLSAGVWLCPEEYAGYLPPALVLYSAVSLYIMLIAAVLYCLLKRKSLAVIYLLVFPVLLLLFCIPFSRKRIDEYFSTELACDYLLKNYTVENQILCAKQFVRGVRYYTDREVAVVNLGGGDFFSPHPIPFLRSDEEVMDFLKSQPVTYCVLRESSFDDVEWIAGREFVVDKLKVIGDKYMARVRTRGPV